MGKKKVIAPVEVQSETVKNVIEPVVKKGLVKIKTTEKNKWFKLGTIQEIEPEVAQILIQKGYAALCQ